MTCFKPAANAPEVCKQDSISETCPADMYQIIIRLASDGVNEITEMTTCSKSIVRAPVLCKWDDIESVCAYENERITV